MKNEEYSSAPFVWVIENWKKIVIGLLVVLVIAVCILAYAKVYGDFKRDCEAMNGHVKSNTSSSTTTGYHTDSSTGKQVYGTYTTTNTVTYCIGNDGGGILDVMG